MRNKKVFRSAAWSLVFGLAVLAGATGVAHASEEKKAVEKQKIVVVGKDGKQRVWEGNGLLMRRGFLGVGLTELTPELRTHFGAPEDTGAMVSRVEPGSPAEKAGIKVGDIITSIDGEDVESTWGLMAKVRHFDDGEQVPIQIWRNGKAQTVTATIAEKERTELDVAPFFFKGGDGEPLVFSLPKGEMKEFEHFKFPDVRMRVSPREVELEKKLKELEKRLNELEKQLGKQKG
jgi:membrane-associated protease RseP (regulator of RpoE activity)